MKDEDISKLFSLVLRHKPQVLKLDMDEKGWVRVSQLISNAKILRNIILTVEDVKKIVNTNNKKRFILSEDNSMIRANQGHSIDVDLQLKPMYPPAILYHGTASRFLASIHASGLKKMDRQYVHLSATKETAVAVGKRHGNPVVLEVEAERMWEDGFRFYLSENKVWLTDYVPAKYIRG